MRHIFRVIYSISLFVSRLALYPYMNRADSAITIQWVRYGQSKLANILFTRELTRRYPAIKSVVLHPGGIETGLSRTCFRSLQFPFFFVF